MSAQPRSCPACHPHLACVQEVLGGWESYSRAQQLELFDDVVVAAHQGAWQKLEGRMQAALLELRMQPQPADEA